MKKVMILAAGAGKRLAPITNTIPKTLLQYKGKAIIHHLITMLEEAGVKEIVINLHHLAHILEGYLTYNVDTQTKLVFSEEKEVLETGGGIQNALPLLSKEPFLIVGGKIITDYPFKKLLDHKLLQGKLAHLVLVPTPSSIEKSDFIVSEQDGMMLAKLPSEGEKGYTFSTMGILHPKLFEYAPKAIKFRLGDLLKDAAEKQEVSAEIWDGFWFDLRTHETLKELNQLNSE